MCLPLYFESSMSENDIIGYPLTSMMDHSLFEQSLIYSMEYMSQKQYASCPNCITVDLGQ